MANIIKTVMTYPLNGSTRDFNIPFEYLARKFVQVTLIGRDRKPLSNIDDYRFTSKNQITTNKAWGSGDGYELIELRRFTSATERLVDFSDGSILRAYDLNVSQIQTLHVAEEARDLTADTIGVNNEGHLDARGRRIVNLADPVNELDAVNLKTIKEWNNGAYQSFIKAQEEANKAARSAAAAKVSETNAYSHMTQAGVSEQRSKASETSAENSKNAAAASAQSASQSAGSASNSAQEATSAKEYTKQQADRSYNEAERAKGYADGIGNAVDIGYTIERMDGNFISWKGNHQWLGSVQVTDNPTAPTKAISMDCWSGGQNLPSISVQDVFGKPRYFLFPTDQSGYLVTDNYLKASVSWDGDSTSIRARASVGIPTSAFIVDNAGASYYHHASNLHALHYQASSGVLVMRKPSDYFTPLRFEYNAVLGAVGGVEWSTDVNGRPRDITFWNEHNGQRTSNVTLPVSESGVVALREWSNSQYLKKAPVASHIWSGEFGESNKEIWLPYSVIGKRILVQMFNRDRYQILQLMWPGVWSTGVGSEYNIFWIAENGRQLIVQSEGGNGRWKNVWVLDN